MGAPLVSVLIPAYNAEETLGATVESVLGQTWSSVEVVVVDDGSQDRTAAVAEGYGGARVVRQENRGAAAARNEALRHASGAYVQFLDADDILAPRKIEAQVARLEAASGRTIATGPWSRFYGAEPPDVVPATQPDFRDYDDPLDWLVQSWNGRGTMPPLAWLLPRAVVEAAGPWNEALSLDDDGEYFARALLAADGIAFCSDAVAYYRSGRPSLSGRRDRAALESQFKVIQLSADRLLDREDSPRTRHAAACRWQGFMYGSYLSAPDLAARAEAEVERLGGGSWELRVSRPIRPIRGLVGWRAAIRLQRAYAALTAPLRSLRRSTRGPA